MALPYELRLHFDELTAQSTVDGTVTVTVYENCTCRKLLLGPSHEPEPRAQRRPEGQVQRLADWDQWQAGEAYTYPFSISADSARDLPAEIKTEVHRIGELDADPAQVWLVPEQARGEREARADVTAAGESPVEPLPTAQPVASEFDIMRSHSEPEAEKDSGVEDRPVRHGVRAWLRRTKGRLSPQPVEPGTHASSVQLFNVATVIASLLFCFGAGSGSSTRVFITVAGAGVLLYLLIWKWPVHCRTPGCTGRMGVQRYSESFFTEDLAYRCSECDDTYSATIFFIQMGGDWD